MVPYVTLRLRLFPHLRWGFANYSIIAIATMGGGESLPGPMWYLIAMLEFTILYACIRFGISKYVIDENKANIYVMIVCVCLMLLGFSTIDLPRMLNRALVLLFWYHLGYMTHTYLEPQKGNIENKKETVITAALSIGILIIGIRGGGGRLATIFVDYPSSRMCRNYSNVGYGTAC